MADDGFAAFQRAFPTDEACLRALAVPDGGGERRCPACGRNAAFQVEAATRGVRCAACGHLDRLCAGAPFERTDRPLAEWLYALARLAPPGGSEDVTKDLEAALGSYKAAWRIEQALREWLARADAAAFAANWHAIAALRLAGPSAPEPAARAPRRRTSLGVFAAGAAVVLVTAVGGGALFLTRGGGGAATSPPRPAAVVTTLAPAPPPPKDLLLLAALAPATAPGAAAAAPSLGTPVPGFRTTPVDLATQGATAPGAAPPPDLAKLPPDLAQMMSARKELYREVTRESAVAGPRNPNEILRFGSARVPRSVFDAIMRGAKAADVDPVLLLAIADRESGFVIQAHAKTSSASGLFQFIESTWLNVVRDFGAKYGLAKEAGEIGHGGFAAAERARILDLRSDPYLSTVFVAEMLKRDGTRIAKKLGRGLTGGEVYAMHFLGADAAFKLLTTAADKPAVLAAALLPKPAEANKPVFYKPGGGARTAVELNQSLDSSITRLMSLFKGASGEAALATAAAEPPPPPDLLDLSRQGGNGE
ncbi:MAG TPA: transglycosylase SLT domain-containing protein [Hyphomicrobiales bacterium]|nr:transglycosylase SLT domain-containing protein [Hyphomicrobiales bacterium]